MSLARRAAGFRYAALDASARATIDRLAGIYARNVREVARIVHSKTDDKAQRFANAFKLRKDP